MAVVGLTRMARAMAPGAKPTAVAAGMATAEAGVPNATIGPVVQAGVTASEASDRTERLATAAAMTARPAVLGVTENGPNARTARVVALSAMNGIRAAKVRPDHPTDLRGVTAMGNAVDAHLAVQTEIDPLARTAAGRVQVARTVPDATELVPVAPTVNVAGTATAAPSAIATVRVRDGLTEVARVTVAAESVPTAAVHGIVAVLVTGSAVSVLTVAAPVMVGAVSVRLAAVLVTGSAVSVLTVVVVTVSGPGVIVTVSVLLAPAVHEMETEDSGHSVGPARGSAPSVRSAGARVEEAESSAAETVSRDATTGVGAMTRAVPTVRAMVTATVDVGATIVAGGKTPSGPATDARRAATAMHVRRKKN